MGTFNAIRDVSLLAVPASCAGPATLERIDLANLRFVTDALPTRSELWRAIAGRGRQLWTNDTATPPGKLAATVADFEALVALAATPILAMSRFRDLDARVGFARDVV
jgi:hypothetical protein